MVKFSKIMVIISISIFLSMNTYSQEINPSSGIKGNEVDTTNAVQQVNIVDDTSHQQSQVIDKNSRSTRRRSQTNTKANDKQKSFQEPLTPVNKGEKINNKSSLTIGFLQGGGSLVGIDFERLIYNKIGIQFGAGFLGIGAALNFHFSPTINSSFISLGYFGQGITGNLSQTSIGPTFVYRGDLFTAQLGIGYVVSRGKTMEEELKKRTGVSELPAFMMLYSIGIYFAFE